VASDEIGSGSSGEPGASAPEDLESTQAATPHSAAAKLVIGPYHLMERIGAGGMGEVWLAEQREPVHRRVALKLIRVGMDSEHVLARFDSERQALALMDHPSIARIFDAGTTPEGRPYFVMEHVAGVSIKEHCNRNRLSTKERLQLMLQVCEGVQHAHQKAVIHRDLKPSNVLIASQDGRAVPKIIDFGLAKALSQRLTERTLHTELGVLVGTPEYMSPEQAERTSQDVDTRTDVYSLGAILYELLAGALPFEPSRLREAGYGGIPKILREEEPPIPSQRVSRQSAEDSATSARERGADPATLKRQLTGDLDWITMKALEKDRARRYGSAAELADDIRRHLHNEPGLAGPPTFAYRAKKFVRRHRLAVIAASVVTLALALGLLGTTASLIRARRAEAAARKEAETADQVAGFLSNVLGSVDPHRLGTVLINDLKQRAAGGARRRASSEAELASSMALLDGALAGLSGTDTARHLLDAEILGRAGAAIDTEISQDPVIASRLHHTIGRTYQSLGMPEAAERHASRALDSRERLLGADHPDTLRSKQLLGDIRYDQGRYPEAEELQRSTLGKLSEAVETQRKAVALVQDVEGPLRARFEARLAQYVEAAKGLPGPAGR
jgi:non-specific serine/threonine protein kinase/serine/threonine-protein kinase